jgi:uncharacterized membrane protein
MIRFWLFVHFVGLVMLAAGVGIANLSGVMMGKASSSAMLAMWSKLNYTIEHIATLPGALILLVAGTILVDKEGYDYTTTWVAAAYVLWVIAVFLGAVVLGRHARQVHALASEEVASGIEEPARSGALARSPIGPVVGNLLNVIVLVFLYLMIFKPGS